MELISDLKETDIEVRLKLINIHAGSMNRKETDSLEESVYFTTAYY